MVIRNIGLEFSFLIVLLSGFDIRAMLASKNVFGSDVSSLVYWKSLRRGITSVQMFCTSEEAWCSVTMLSLFSVRCCRPGGSVLGRTVSSRESANAHTVKLFFLPSSVCFVLVFFFCSTQLLDSHEHTLIRE